MRIKAEEAMGIAVDFQEKLVPVIFEKEELIRRSQILIRGLREFSIPILVSQQYTKGLGGTVEPIAQALGHYEPMEKKAFSLWQDAGIRNAILAGGKKKIIVFGTEAHICVLQTVIDLRANGYEVYYVQDCVGSRKANDKSVGVKRAEQEGAFIVTCESLLYELTVSAEDPHFRAVSKLTK